MMPQAKEAKMSVILWIMEANVWKLLVVIRSFVGPSRYGWPNEWSFWEVSKDVLGTYPTVL